MNRRIVVALAIHLVGAALAGAPAHTAIAQGAVHPAALTTPIGTWRGTSSCLVRPSGCHDEIVVYRITPMKAADSLSIDAFRIVRGEELDMGVLGCRLLPPSGQITCSIPQGVWRFTVRGNSLTGELRLPDNTRFRDVRAIRARGP
ncbi:MAG: hypothetical protein ACJ8AK_06300 [Gemmatimonadaceae bacterium]